MHEGEKCGGIHKVQVAEVRYAEELAALELAGNLRELRTVQPDGLYLEHDGRRYLNLSSNDYLGLSASAYGRVNLGEYGEQVYGEGVFGSFPHGTPASRLMTGNCREYEVLESELAALFPGRAALVLGCGYMVNSGLLPALAGKNDLILADKLVHASIIEGIRLADAPFRRFRHNDVEQLETLLRGAGNAEKVWVIVEALYSMDGDSAPLREIVGLKQRYGFKLYVDEAHSFAVRGPQGTGLCAEWGLAEQVDVLVCTFGKAMAGAGACAIVSPMMRRYLVNRMRPLIFSTALPPCTLQWDALVLHEMREPTLHGMPSLASLRAQLANNIKLFHNLSGLPATSQIIPLPAGSNERALTMAEQGREAGYWLTAIRHPTVPLGSARIRLSLNAGLNRQHISEFATLCKKLG